MSPEADPRALFNLLVTEKRKRDDLNSRVREAIADLRLLKEERDKVNAEVAEMKEARNSSRQQGRELLKQAKQLRDALKGFEVPKGRSDSLGKLIEELDFKYQTKPMPFDDEKKLVKKIEELRKLFRAKRFVEKKRENIKGISHNVEDLFSTSDELHQSILDKARKSEELHKAFIEKIHEIDGLRAKSNEAHALVIKYSRELGDARSEAEEERSQRRAEEMIEREKLLKARAEKVKATLTGKKSFNLRDLQVLGAAGEDFSFEKAGKDEED
jgi:uncharacterized coiled-coil DUF342 family protein